MSYQNMEKEPLALKKRLLLIYHYSNLGGLIKMRKVNNGIVEMDWDAEGFIESKKLGFISAVHSYDGVAVVFRDGKIYQHVEDGEPLSFVELVDTIKSCVKSKDPDYPYYYDDYFEIYDGTSFSQPALELLGLEDKQDDMLARLKDLGAYNEMVEEAMV